MKRKKRNKRNKRAQMREHLKEPWRPPKIEKERGISTTILYSTLVLMWAPTLQFLESFHIFSCITMWGSFHCRTWLAYSKDEPPQVSSRSSWESELDAPPLVPLERFHTFIALCACVAWQSLLLLQCQVRDFLLSYGYPLHCLSLYFWPSKPPSLFSLP